MNGKIKVIGANKVTEFLLESEDNDAFIEYDKGLHTIKLKEKKYLFDLKKTTMHEDFVLMWGWISNEKMAGQICFQFFPKKS